MHSELEQKERDTVMLKFKARHIDVLVATDIVARGIDIDDITMVINYDVPHDAEDYVHRIGRTARAGRDGRAVTLVGERDTRALAQIERLLKGKGPRAELPAGLESPQATPHSASKPKGKDGNRRKQDKAAEGQKPHHKSRKYHRRGHREGRSQAQ